jgi:hypothetical protein
VRSSAPKPKAEPESENVWEWLAPDEPSTLKDELGATVDEPKPDPQPEPQLEEPEPLAEAPEVPGRPPLRHVERSQPSPPVSPDPAVEDVRGAWKPPPNG